MPIKFWGECILIACVLISRNPSPLLQWDTPYFRIYGKHVDYSFLRTFGCLCFTSTLQNKRLKFDPHAIPAVFFGYPPDIKS